MLRELSLFGPAVANHLWQSTIFAMAVWAATLLLRRNAARLRHALWVAASMKFLLPFSLLIGLGGLLPQPRRLMPSAPGQVYSALGVVGQPFHAGETLSGMRPVARQQYSLTWLSASLLAVWLCGLVAVVLVWAARWYRFAAMARTAERIEDGREAMILRRLDPAGRIALRRSTVQMEPGVFGIVHPVLLWPEGLSERLQDEHIEAILLHELTHVRRRDNLMASLHMLVEAAFWFHPLVWWLERCAIIERERACDEAVVAISSSAEIYAESLLKTCRFCLESPVACVSGITGGDLNNRVRFIMQSNVQRLSFVGKMLLAMAVAAAAGAPVVFAGSVTVPISAVSQTKEVTSVPAPSFDTASIHPARLSMGCFSMLPPGGTQYAATCVSLRNLIQLAYDTSYLDGGGQALDTYYDVRASTGEDPWTEESIRPMMRQLLAQRFHLVVHESKRDLSGYRLVIAKGGPKIQPASRESVPRGQKAGQPSQNFVYPGRAQGRGLDSRGMASLLSLALHAPVADATGLTGIFNIDLSYAPDNSTESNLPSLFVAVEEQLGLKLQSGKVTVDTIVIDHVDAEPTPN